MSSSKLLSSLQQSDRHNQKRAKALSFLEGQTHLGARKESLRNFLNWSHINSFSDSQLQATNFLPPHNTIQHNLGTKALFPSKEHDNKYQSRCFQVFFLASIITHTKKQDSSIPPLIKWFQTLLQQQRKTAEFHILPYHPDGGLLPEKHQVRGNYRSLTSQKASTSSDSGNAVCDLGRAKRDLQAWQAGPILGAYVYWMVQEKESPRQHQQQEHVEAIGLGGMRSKSSSSGISSR